MVEKTQVISDIVKYLVEVIEVPREEFSGFAVCPFAKSERTSGKLMIDVFDPADCDFVQKVTSMVETGHHSGLFALFQGDTPVEISEGDTKNFQVFLNKTLRVAGMKEYKTICFNPNDLVDADGFNPRDKCPYFLINVARRDVLNNAHKSLTKTKYFDRLSIKYRKFLKMDL